MAKKKKQWMSKTDSRYGRNLSRVKDMVDGNYQGKLQVSQYTTTEETRKVGDKWTDSDGNEWEQKEGFRVKGRQGRHYSWDKKCKKCDTLILKKWDKHAYDHSGHCYYCGIDFEAKMKTYPVKWFAYQRLQSLRNMESIEKDMVQWIEEKESLDKKKIYDMSVANALSNANIDMSIKTNSKT